MMYYINRFKSDDNGTFSTLTDNIGHKYCYFIESTQHLIPEGTYNLEPYNSPVHGEVWQVMDVPNRTNIEWHPANWAHQLLGCMAPGNAIGVLNGLPAVLNSQNTFSALKDELPQTFSITVRSTL